MSVTPSSSTPPRRILVIGSTASRKTTVAVALSQRWNLPHVELDRLHWGPNWTKRPEFAEEVARWIAQDAWVIDGSYLAAVAQAWPRAERVLWLDLPRIALMRDLFTRTIRRIVTKEDVCNGNRETFRSAFMSRDSLFLWLWKTYHPRRDEYAALAAQHPNVSLRRLDSPRLVVDMMIGLARTEPIA